MSVTRIDRLADEERARMDEWADKWIDIGLRTEPADRKRFEASVRDCYRFAGIPFPDVVVWVPSPLVLAFAAPAAAVAIELYEAAERRQPLGSRGAVGDAVGGAVDDAVRGAVDGAVDGAVRGAVDGAVGDAVGGAVGDAVGDAVRDAVRGAVGGAVDDAVRGAVDDAVGGAVDGAVRGAVGGAVGDAVDGAVGGAVDGAVRDAVRGAVGGAVRGAVDGAVGGAVDGAVDGAVGDAVRGAVRGAVDDAVRGAVDDAVGGAVDGAVRGAVGGAVGDAVDGAVGGAVDGAVRDAVRGAVGGAVRGAVDGAVGGAVDGAVDGAVGDAVRGAVRGAVDGGEIKRAVLDAIARSWYRYMGGQFWAGGWGWWGPAYTTFFRDVCNLELPGDTWDRGRALEGTTESACWWWPHRRFVMVCERPREIHRELANPERPRGWGSHRLHNDAGPAVAWPDGWGVWSIHGVRVTRQIVEAPETLTVEQIRGEQNAEVRRIMVERFGAERYLRESDALLLDDDPEWGKLWRVELVDDEDLVMVEVINSTPEPDGHSKTYWLRVPPGMTTARAAVAWTFDVPVENYELEAQT